MPNIGRRAFWPARRRPDRPEPSRHPRRTIPTRPITLVVPFPPGGSTTDRGPHRRRQARRNARPADRHRQPRRRRRHRRHPRGRAKPTPDGYTIVLGYTGTLAIGPSLYSNVGYDPRKDFAPIGRIGTAPNTLVVHPSFTVKIGQRADRLRQGQSRQGQLRLGRRRHRQPRLRRIFRHRRRHQARAHSLQGHRAGADRPDRRPHPDGVRADPGHARATTKAGKLRMLGGDQR